MSVSWLPVVLSLAAVAPAFAQRAGALPQCARDVRQSLVGKGPGVDPSAAVGWGPCAIEALRDVLQGGHSTDDLKLRAVESLGYLARFRQHFEAAGLLRWTVENHRDALRTAGLEALRAAGLSISSAETNLDRYARHPDPAIRSALIALIERDCDRSDRGLLESGLADEPDAALRTKWRLALQRLEGCPPSYADRQRELIVSVMRQERHFAAFLCDPKGFAADDHFVVLNLSGQGVGPQVSQRRSGAAAVRLLPELESLLSLAGQEALECRGAQCVHRGRINGYEFAFWFGADRTCVSRIVRTHEDLEPDLH